jgi:hypothetical protein
LGFFTLLALLHLLLAFFTLLALLGDTSTVLGAPLWR